MSTSNTYQQNIHTLADIEQFCSDKLHILKDTSEQASAVLSELLLLIQDSIISSFLCRPSIILYFSVASTHSHLIHAGLISKFLDFGLMRPTHPFCLHASLCILGLSSFSLFSFIFYPVPSISCYYM